MSSPDIYTDIAESILEHAAVISRLDADVIGVAEYEATFASRVHAMRLLAVAHVDPQPDRKLVRQLRTLSGNFPGVFVQLADGAIRLVIDTASKQHKVNLWTRRQLLRNEEEDDFMDH